MKGAFLVPKNRLMAFAGVLWMTAGCMVCSIAWQPLKHLLPVQPMLLMPAFIIFSIFYLRIFRPLVEKHACRVRALSAVRQPAWLFFDRKGYITMAIMMAGGATLRNAAILPDWTIAFLYAGIGSALFLAGLRFICFYCRRWVMEGDCI